MSSLLLVDRSEAELTEYLAKLSLEFGEEGAFTDETRKVVKADREKLWGRLSSVKDNVIHRYEELGLAVEVKELALFLDWDDDGEAGNETIKEGETVTLETTELNVPVGGGTYDIKISSPVPVYLKPLVGFWEDPSGDIIDGSINLYANVNDIGDRIEKNINGDVLTVKVSAVNSRIPQTTLIYLYDCVGNVLGEVHVMQEGNKDASVPQLGEYGISRVEDMAASMARGFSKLNLVEQYYLYNKVENSVEQNIYPSNGSCDWTNFYSAIRLNLSIMKADSKQLSVYQDVLKVFNAMYYYNLVVFWGGVPYITDNELGHGVARTDESTILNNLIAELNTALECLDEKRNESLGDVNAYFLVSKDVARILLANIYMYRGDYASARPLLSKVIDNGFYELDGSNYSKRETIDNLRKNGSGKETIFATNQVAPPITRGGMDFGKPDLVPVMNYTDVVLSYAECLYKQGDVSLARKQLNDVLAAKNFAVKSDDVLAGIAEARKELLLYTVGNFAFMKRNNMAREEYGVDSYRLLLPISMQVLEMNSMITQNPGYY